MNIISDRFSSVKPSLTKAMTQKAAALRGQGRDIITLSQGEPDFPTPEPICEAGIEAIRAGNTRYTAVAGIEPLREAIVEKFSRDNSLSFSTDQISVGCGAKQILFNALMVSLNPGDEVLFPTPCWVSYPDMVHLAGGIAVPVSCLLDTGFKLTPDLLEAAITPKTKWLMLNSPSNPTGAVYSRAELEALAEVLRKHANVWVLSDDIYEKLVYEDVEFTTLTQVAPDLRDRILTVNGVSKSYAMTGWRVGYGAGPAQLIKAMNTLQGQTTSHTSSISQYAAMEALRGSQDFIKAFRSTYQYRRDLVVDGLNRVEGISCRRPDGAFYVFPDCSGLMNRQTPQGKIIKTDSDLTMYLLEEAGVATVPGSGFLASPFIRISYATSTTDLERACDRIASACSLLK
ncbi:pyridoxal phosphate-dependent aminotransferase [Kiloniella sp.]|uniref:pyridoxal phosphate-dependent aminotransferase n=1 Tax=Kiloniella sp. TaxID=1938587 RepID=UPI003B012A03